MRCANGSTARKHSTSGAEGAERTPLSLLYLYHRIWNQVRLRPLGRQRLAWPASSSLRRQLRAGRLSPLYYACSL